MKTKTIEYLGLGFPIELIDVPILNTAYGPALDIDHTKLHTLVFKMLSTMKGHFSGAHIKFIRHHMELTQKHFSDLLRVDRSSVAKWEGKDQEVADMHDSTRMLLRLYMLHYLKGAISETEFKKVEAAARAQGLGGALRLNARKLVA